MKNRVSFCILLLLMVSCSDDDASQPTIPSEEIYFPPLTGTEWETLSPSSLGWKTEAIPELVNYLEQNNTRAFLVLKDGKIVMEEYMDQAISGSSFGQNSYWYWASAGKTLTSFLVGIAQEEGHLSLSDPSAKYLGNGWTSLSTEQENQITIRHQLTMTTGLSTTVDNLDCTEPACLQYLVSPGARWFYHNAPYTLLDGVVEGATNQDFDSYFKTRLADKIGLIGFWQYLDYNHIYFSTARSMARFGLLVLNNGKWENTVVLGDKDFLTQMSNTSQDLNLSYGYLWWLNGKSSFIPPGFSTAFQGMISPKAPAEMFAAMGKNGQFINIVPSENLVVIRMGEAPDGSLVPIIFQNEMWEKLNVVLNR